MPILDYYVLLLEDGRAIKLTGQGTSYSSLDNKYSLSIDSNIYRVIFNEQDKDAYSFNEYFELESYSNKYGLIYSLEYENHILSKLITRANKELLFELDDHNHIIKISLPNNSSIIYDSNA